MFSSAPRPSFQDLMAFGSRAVRLQPSWDMASACVSGLNPTFLCWVMGEAFSLASSILWHSASVVELRHCCQSLLEGGMRSRAREKQDLYARRKELQSHALSLLPGPIAFPS